jgi:hypothetical protein
MRSAPRLLIPFFAGTTLRAVTKAPDPIPALRPPGGEIPPGFWEAHGALTVAGALLALVLAGLAAWFFTRRKPVSLPPAETLARRALKPLLHQPEGGALLSRVSQVLRHYFTAAFGLPPGELTTAEFCLLVGQNEAVGPELTAAVAAFLHRCDERKFAPAVSPPALGAVQQALQLIQEAEGKRRLAEAAKPAPSPSARPPFSAPRPPAAELQPLRSAPENDRQP